VGPVADHAELPGAATKPKCVKLAAASVDRLTCTDADIEPAKPADFSNRLTDTG
jgi:hypothetical protein